MNELREVTMPQAVLVTGMMLAAAGIIWALVWAMTTLMRGPVVNLKVDESRSRKTRSGRNSQARKTRRRLRNTR